MHYCIALRTAVRTALLDAWMHYWMRLIAALLYCIEYCSTGCVDGITLHYLMRWCITALICCIAYGRHLCTHPHAYARCCGPRARCSTSTRFSIKRGLNMRVSIGMHPLFRLGSILHTFRVSVCLYVHVLCFCMCMLRFCSCIKSACTSALPCTS